MQGSDKSARHIHPDFKAVNKNGDARLKQEMRCLGIRTRHGTFSFFNGAVIGGAINTGFAIRKSLAVETIRLSSGLIQYP